jgi:hypothetical protein
MRKSRLLPLLVAFALLLAAPAAEAAPVTIGASLTGTFNKSSCSGECTIIGAGNAPSYTAPVSGVILHWQILGGAPGHPYKLRVFSPGAADAYTAVGSSAVAKPVTAGVETFPASVPIKAGQTIGIDLEATQSLGQNSAAGQYTFIEPHPADGETQTAGAPTAGEWAFNAEIQPAPTITAVTPTAGATAGGTQVSIAGNDFKSVSAVRFGSTPATAVAVNSENLITATAPAGSTPVTISVTTIAGTATWAQPFTFTAPLISPPPPPRTCTVPKLKGKTLKSAKRHIRSADCKVGHLTKKGDATAKDGKVVKQVPAPGTAVPVGTKVRVTLAVAPK